MSWHYFQPNFDYEQKLEDLDQPWEGHKNFAYDLVRNSKPKRIVELGTHWGTSFFSMAQAVKDGRLPTELTAIDTWRGDKHSGQYGEEVIAKVKEIKATFYPSLKIKLLQSTFDEAITQFADRSIDCLHIDGLHTYDAVKHDLDSWLPKVSLNGIILLHDTHEHSHDFGVHQLWAELKKKYPTLEFSHSHGLGVLFLDRQIHQQLAAISDIWPDYYRLGFEARILDGKVARLETQLGQEREHSQALMEELALLAETKEQLHQIQEMRRHITDLEMIINGIRHSKVFRFLRLPGALRTAMEGKNGH